MLDSYTALYSVTLPFLHSFADPTMAILHRTRDLSALMPRYAESFRCIGSSCESSCCVGWPVHIDKKTYKAYRNQAHPALRSIFAKIERVADERHPDDYAMLKLRGPQGACPAHQDGMCLVQAALGESYLSDTCQSYPRISRQVNGQMEQSMSLSCPEAARLALLDGTAFDFVEAPVSVREGTVHATNAGVNITPELMNEVRIFCLNLVRTRELAMWQRLALLGMFCETLERHQSGQVSPGIETIIDDFTRMIGSGELVSALAQIQPNHEAQAMVFATLWGAKGFSVSSPFHQTLMQRIALGLGAEVNGQTSAVALVGAYRNGLERLDSALESAPWLLEHYLLNEMFSQLFPLTGSNAYQVYLQLVARFGLLRLLLAAQCNADIELPSLSMLASTVALQCRWFQHDAAYTKQVNQSLLESGWADLHKVCTLLRT